VLTGLGFGVSHFSRHSFNGINPEHLREDLDASLAVGSTLDEGRDWFRKHGIRAYEHRMIVMLTRRCYGHKLAGSVVIHTLFQRDVIVIELEYGLDGRLKSISFR
jgi:hypothetical protein